MGTVVASGDVVALIEDTQLLLRRDEQRAEVARAQARLKFLENEERRFVTLAESNLAAATKLEETRSDRDMSRGDLQVARSRLAQIEDQLSRTRIKAPFGGIASIDFYYYQSFSRRGVWYQTQPRIFNARVVSARLHFARHC